MACNKRKCLSFETKLKIIEEAEKGQKTKAEICREYGIPKSSLSTFLKDKEKIQKAIDHGTSKHKRLRASPLDKVDEALLIWFKQARSDNVPLSGPILLEKAEELARILGHEDQPISTGWLDRFKARHGIVFKVVSGEAASASNIDTSDWEKQLDVILHDYEPRDIYNADETGLFYKCLPNRSLAFQGETCTGQKVPKNRISILCAANMDGSEKLPLLSIGKFQKPR